MDRSHLEDYGKINPFFMIPDYGKINPFSRFQKLTKLWAVKFESWTGSSRSGGSFLEITTLLPLPGPFFVLLHHVRHVRPTQKVSRFAPLDLLFPTVCHNLISDMYFILKRINLYFSTSSTYNSWMWNCPYTLLYLKMYQAFPQKHVFLKMYHF